MSLLTLGSRVLGLARDIAMAVLFGNGVILDSFTLAFRLPNLARSILGEGTLSTAFLPAYIRERVEQGVASADRLASVFLVFLTLLLGIIVLIVELTVLAIPTLISVSDEMRLLLELSAILFPYILLICLSAQLNAVLNAREHFAWPALMPWILNLTWLAGVMLAWWLTPIDTRRIEVISASILLGGIGQLAGSWWMLKRLGFQPHWNVSGSPWRNDWQRVRHLWWSLLPIFLGLSITQFNTLLDSLIAWMLAYLHRGVDVGTMQWLPRFEDGSASALYIGQRLYQFPLGIFGVALGTVLYPRMTMARHAQDGRFADELLRGLRLIVLLGLPASFGLCLLAEPITRTLFFHGAFDQQDLAQTSTMIAAYGLGVWAYMLLLILNRAFFAMEDRWTPLRAGILSVATNVILSFALIPWLSAPGLAVATAGSSALQVIWLMSKLKTRVADLDILSLTRVSLIGLAGSAAMTAISWLLFSTLYAQTTSTLGNGLLILTQITVCAAVYAALLWLLNCKELRPSKN